MAPANTPRPGRALAVSAIVLIALYAAVFLGKTQTPQLGLDLRGGTSVTLTPRPENGKGKVTKASLSKAVDIIRQRVNGLGVAEADVATEGNNIVVSVPGKGRSEVIKLVGTTAQLRFRQVLQSAPATAPAPSATPTPSGSAKPGASPSVKASAKPTARASAQPSAKSSAKPSASPTSNGRVVPPALAPGADRVLAATPSATPSRAASPQPQPSSAPTVAPVAPTPAATPSVPASTQQKFATIDCRSQANRQGGGTEDPKQPLVACDRDGTTKYLLAPAEVLGTDVRTATASISAQNLGGWQVVLDFTGRGTNQFGDLTKRVQPLPSPTNQVAVVLDGVVQSSPQIIEPILDGRAQITGNFSQTEAKDLASVLKFGALPLSFDIPTAETISPTLGSEQLKGGLIAGAIGLGLVILYSLLYYRALGLVTIASLALSGAIIYAATTLLGHIIGYTLTLAGIAGFIVAVGITADSFVVFFERLRDEVREGRTLRSGVERGWVRARRTILSADTVSLLAAVVLYLVSVGGVRGFAFTLGLSTIVDLFIVFLFTKPLVSLLARTRFFDTGGAMSGLSAGRQTGRIRRRGSVATSGASGASGAAATTRGEA